MRVANKTDRIDIRRKKMIRREVLVAVKVIEETKGTETIRIQKKMMISSKMHWTITRSYWLQGLRMGQLKRKRSAKTRKRISANAKKRNTTKKRKNLIRS